MYQVTKQDLEKIKSLFDYYQYRYDEISEYFSSLNYTEIKYSNVYMDFYPFESDLQGYKAGKFYKKTPRNINKTITNKLINDKIYYCFDTQNKLWGERFYIYEDTRTIYLCYTINHFTDKMELSMIYLMEYDNNVTVRVFFFGNDNALGYKSMVDYREYDTLKNNITIHNYDYLFEQQKWEYSGYYYINHIDSDKYTIYSIQKDKNGNEIRQQIYPR